MVSMQTHTLVLVNLLFFLLYAGVLLVSARINGGTKGATWFAGANICRGLAMAVVLMLGARSMALSTGVVSTLLVVGMLMLHRSFSELLDRGHMLWALQLCLVAVVAAVGVYEVWRPSAYPVQLLVMSVILGVQTALTASVVFSFAGEGVEAAGVFTGVTLTVYAFIHMLRVAVMLRVGSEFAHTQSWDEMEKVWLVGSLLANGAVAFGYMFISAAKLRLELLWRAQVDELTGLLNRWAFKRVALKETVRCKRMSGRLAVVMMDIDGLKGVNDHYGHGCGDAVLQGVSSVLQDTVRDHDYVARMGGDEFCVLLPDTDMEEAMTVAERLRVAIDRLEIRYRSDSLKVHSSFGVSSSDCCGSDWQTLVDMGDAALYEAKRGGKNRVVAAKAIEVPTTSWAEVQVQHALAERRRR
jgi:diguanylate cyclase (GGDEF)-like protein